MGCGERKVEIIDCNVQKAMDRETPEVRKGQ